MTASMKVVETPLSDLVVKFILRNPSEEKVREISESISQVGLISPIVISPDNILLAGYHRYLAYKKLGLDTIPSIVKDVDNSVSELVEVDENLMRPAEVDTLLADYSKAKKILKWNPKTSFDDLVSNMVEEDLKNVGKSDY